ncbi:uncharacterized protein [Henckelia pumila]|uniref:uncharacterized protein n=1 Tax=Henckelia pumila TaxID=405737 RepID=UPI003C6DF351
MERPKISESKENSRRADNSSKADALAQMPNYARFLKDLLKNKKKPNDLVQVTINEQCSALIQNRLPQKFQDPGRASINLLLYSLAKKLGMGVIEPTTIFLKLAYRSVKYPRGVAENILIKVDKLIFPVDFVVLDMDEDYESVRDNPIGKSFFAIDVVNNCVREFMKGNDNHDAVSQPQDQKSPAKGVGGIRDSARHTTAIVDDPP